MNDSHKQKPEPNLHKKKQSLTEYKPPQPQNGAKSGQYLSTNVATLNDPIQIENWPKRALGSLREEKSYEYEQGNSKLTSSKYHNDRSRTLDSDEDYQYIGGDDEQKTHRSNDTVFKLNTKRMNYKGFEFGDFGFMTTDFDQLSRGHTELCLT